MSTPSICSMRMWREGRAGNAAGVTGHPGWTGQVDELVWAVMDLAAHLLNDDIQQRETPYAGARAHTHTQKKLFKVHNSSVTFDLCSLQPETYVFEYFI